MNSLLHNKIVDLSKLKVFADNKIDVIRKLKFVSGRIENIVGKGENAGYQHFLLFPHFFFFFQKASDTKSLKVGIFGKELRKRIRKLTHFAEKYHL